MAIVRPVNRVVVDKKLTLRLDQMPPATTPAWRRRSPMLWGPIRQRAITGSNETTRPRRPRSVVQVTSRCRAMRTSAAFAAGPAAWWSSGASRSARRTSIHSFGSAVLPTQRPSPSPTYRTVPENRTPGWAGRGASHGSACAGATEQKKAGVPARRRGRRLTRQPSTCCYHFFSSARANLSQRAIPARFSGM